MFLLLIIYSVYTCAHVRTLKNIELNKLFQTLFLDPFITAPVIGAFTGCSAVIFLLLPKTHNVPLPKTISDARNMKR